MGIIMSFISCQSYVSSQVFKVYAIFLAHKQCLVIQEQEIFLLNLLHWPLDDSQQFIYLISMN
jgi:hypothetical protein